MKMLVGLGNPGKKYSHTRHNIGFKVLEELARRHQIEKEESRYDAIVGHLRINQEKLLLVKPLTFMNLSGKAVRPLFNWFKLELSELLVVYDDMDLPPGTVRIRASGGTGGHKGMQSICESLGSRDFPRIRIGIGRPPGGAIDWVLGEFSESEKPLMQEAVEKAASAIECWVKSGIDASMNAYN